MDTGTPLPIERPTYQLWLAQFLDPFQRLLDWGFGGWFLLGRHGLLPPHRSS